MHALIIEDEGAVASVIEAGLRECGFTSFDVAPSAHSAVIAAALRKPDLITSDVLLKPGDGIATVESLSQADAIPTVFITAYAADVVRRLPHHRVIDKPFTVRMLVAAVASAMLEVADESAENAQSPSTGSS